ncbi:general transcriptional corepressor CYC8, partial [Tremellales sp. Uapishka_1]
MYQQQPQHPSYPPSSSVYHHRAPPPIIVGGPPQQLDMHPQRNGHSQPSRGIPEQSPAIIESKRRMDSLLDSLSQGMENTWMLIGAVSEQQQDQDRAMQAFENALRHNPTSVIGLNAVASIARSRDDFNKAIEYFQRILNLDQTNGEVWGSMGHCLLMKDDLPKAYTAYQQALYHLPNPKEPKLWYGIGILYDRYGSFEHAEEAFSSVLKMDPNFEKANEIYFRLGIIYKHQRKYAASLDCFKWILSNPPRPLTSWDIWFQLGHVYEQDHDYVAARDAYMRVLGHQPDHAKVLQQLGWLYHQPGAPFANQDQAVAYLTKSLETDGSDAQSWYLLGRAFMAGQRYNKAYEAYQQAVYRDGRNPTFWCSIGVLYYQINQYRDALDAYSRAIRLNNYISEVWYNLGSLYESCNNQITDAVDAYSRAADLDPTNTAIKQRLALLQNASSSNGQLPPPPAPVDVHPSQYTAAPSMQPPGANGSPNASPHLSQVQIGPGENGPQGGRDLPPPPPGAEFGRGHSPGPGPFRGGGPPPPLAHVDESRGSMGRHAPLAPIETGGDSRDHYRDRERERENQNGGPRRHGESPGFPPYQSQPQQHHHQQQQQQPPPPQPSDWERRDRRHDPRHPSPRMHDRDPRRQPSPRIPQEYDRGSALGPFYFNHDGRGQEQRNVSGGGYPYDPTQRREARYDPPPPPQRASPAPSNPESRKRKSEESKVLTAAKRNKDDTKPVVSNAKKNDKKDKPMSLKVTLNKPKEGDAVSSNSSPKSVEGNGNGSGTPNQRPPASAPARVVDEDYDEGAADALMFLHGDRPAGPPQETISPTRQRSVSVAGSKRPSPPSSPPPLPEAKKAKPDTENGPASAKSKMVIEVLNASKVDSMSPGVSAPPRGAVEGVKGKEEETVPALAASPEVEKMEVEAQQARVETPPPPPPREEEAAVEPPKDIVVDVPEKKADEPEKREDELEKREDIVMAEPEAEVAVATETEKGRSVVEGPVDGVKEKEVEAEPAEISKEVEKEVSA